jgi:uncharacterized membrane protein YvbJ
MPICPNCGATVPEGAIACGKCGASLVSTKPLTSSPFQSQPNSAGQSSGSTSTSWSSGYDSALETRLQKALRRNELLSYAVVALSVFLLVLLFTGL